MGHDPHVARNPPTPKQSEALLSINQTAERVFAWHVSVD